MTQYEPDPLLRAMQMLHLIKPKPLNIAQEILSPVDKITSTMVMEKIIAPPSTAPKGLINLSEGNRLKIILGQGAGTEVSQISAEMDVANVDSNNRHAYENVSGKIPFIDLSIHPDHTIELNARGTVLVVPLSSSIPGGLTASCYVFGTSETSLTEHHSLNIPDAKACLVLSGSSIPLMVEVASQMPDCPDYIKNDKSRISDELSEKLVEWREAESFTHAEWLPTLSASVHDMHAMYEADDRLSSAKAQENRARHQLTTQFTEIIEPIRQMLQTTMKDDIEPGTENLSQAIDKVDIKSLQPGSEAAIVMLKISREKVK